MIWELLPIGAKLAASATPTPSTEMETSLGYTVFVRTKAMKAGEGSAFSGTNTLMLLVEDTIETRSFATSVDRKLRLGRPVSAPKAAIVQRLATRIKNGFIVSAVAERPGSGRPGQ